MPFIISFSSRGTLPAFLAVIAATVTPLLAQQALPEGRGRNETQRICGQCHGVEMATKLRMNEERWAGVVDDMVSRGAQGTQDEFDRVAKYLAKNFGPDTPVAGARLSINKATAKEMTAAGIAEDAAAAIVGYREKNGPYKTWQDLEKVPGLDLKKLEGKKDVLDFTVPGS
ncbi:MAG TPA: helix-hairpin-helix domain-containing protein [Bryobacteraceae bacterium]|nr:helix-hairpin-helix domain-containing protein [Bryobacteraceae bacterium]